MTRPTARTTPARLPASARVRLARAEHATVRTSLLTAPSAYGVRAAGFEAIGDVMGCIATQVSFEYLARCGVSSPRPTGRVVFAQSSGCVTSSLVRQLSGAYRTALQRLRSEAVALGADGVVGIRIDLQRWELLREVVAVGTAIRSTGRVHTTRPFTTVLSADDVVKLLAAGWAPVEAHVAVQLGVRHIDPQTIGDLRVRINSEVSGYTDLRQRVTTAAGTALRGQAARAGADGVLLSGDIEFESWHRPCVTTSSDLVGLATATGTSIARFARAAARPPSPLTILPLSGKRR